MIGNLLSWAIGFLIVALIAALLGFGGLAGTATDFATMLFWIALVLAVVFFVLNAVGGRRGI